MSGIPLLTQLFNSFLGVQEGIHSILLPDIFSADGSRNLYTDKFARARRILGYAAQNGTAITTNGGGSAVLGRMLYPYRKTSGASPTRQLLAIVDDGVNEWELWKSTDDGASWTFVSDLGASSVGFTPDMGQMGDTAILTNGVITPRKYNTSFSVAGGTQSPKPTAVAGTSGNLSGTIQFKLVSIEADGSRHPGSLSSDPVQVQGERLDLSWTADPDTDVVGTEVYRTSGTGKVYYFESYVDGRTTAAYASNTVDADIIQNRILEEHGDAPPAGVYYCEPHKQRMWYFRTDTYPQRGWFSDPGLPESVLDANNLPFADADTQGDHLTGSKGNYEGLLVVGQERSLWVVSGDGTIIGDIANWTVTRSNARVGWVSHRTVARVPAGSKYTDQNGEAQATNISTLAYLTPYKDIRLFDGDNDIIISHPIKDTLATLNYASREKAYSVQDDTRDEIAFVFPSGSSGEPDTAVVWNYRFGVWYPREWGFGHMVQQDSGTEGAMLLGITNSRTVGAGLVHLLWSGHTFNGASFVAQWMTKSLYGAQIVGYKSQPALSFMKRWRWLDLLFETEQNTELTVEWLEGDTPANGSAVGSATFTPDSVGVLTMSGDTLASADGDALVLAAQSTLARVKLRRTGRRYLHHRGIRIRVYDRGSTGQWSIEAMNLAYQVLPGLKRRRQIEV